jgi:hypothetical protein
MEKEAEIISERKTRSIPSMNWLAGGRDYLEQPGRAIQLGVVKG